MALAFSPPRRQYVGGRDADGRLIFLKLKLHAAVDQGNQGIRCHHDPEALVPCLTHWASFNTRTALAYQNRLWNPALADTVIALTADTDIGGDRRLS